MKPTPDLAELDRLLAAATPGSMNVSASTALAVAAVNALPALLARVRAAEARVAALEAAGRAVMECADHQPDCPYMLAHIQTDDDCTCGYLAAADALAALLEGT